MVEELASKRAALRLGVVLGVEVDEKGDINQCLVDLFSFPISLSFHLSLHLPLNIDTTKTRPLSYLSTFLLSVRTPFFPPLSPFDQLPS